MKGDKFGSSEPSRGLRLYARRHAKHGACSRARVSSYGIMETHGCTCHASESCAARRGLLPRSGRNDEKAGGRRAARGEASGGPRRTPGRS
eukprot:3197589-Prymnesium_polylepis.1